MSFSLSRSLKKVSGKSKTGVSQAARMTKNLLYGPDLPEAPAMEEEPVMPIPDEEAAERQRRRARARRRGRGRSASVLTGGETLG